MLRFNVQYCPQHGSSRRFVLPAWLHGINHGRRSAFFTSTCQGASGGFGSRWPGVYGHESEFWGEVGKLMRNAWHNARSVSRLAVRERRLDTTIERCKFGLRRVSRWAERVGLGDCMALREVRWRSPSPSFDGFLERFLFFPQLTICTKNNSNPWGEQVIRVHNHKQYIQFSFLFYVCSFWYKSIAFLLFQSF
jgi:hypothetical protein